MKKNHLERVGDTPLVRLRRIDVGPVHAYAKLEFHNPTGSVKDRAAAHVLGTLIRSFEIDQETMIIESSSGNFGIALSAAARRFGLNFTCVIDPNITPINELLLMQLGARVVKVRELDETNGYLRTRIRKVKELCAQNPNSYWVNQYENPLNADTYYQTLGTEICDGLERVDYVFLGVSSGGTITGVSRKVKERYPNAKVIAVDMVGSVIFGQPSRKRYIPGIGSGIVPPILKQAKIDEVVHVDERESILACHELLQTEAIFAGGSSGSVVAGIRKYFDGCSFDTPPNVVTVFADRGERYVDTIYNSDWHSRFTSEPERTVNGHARHEEHAVPQ
jgi:cysteine synthase A